MGLVIGIINQKGGVGKTTTAVNLAAYLAGEGYRTLLIDEDSQGNATSGLFMDKKAFAKTLYDVLVNDEPPKNAIFPTEIKNLSVLPSSLALAGAEVELVGEIGREHMLRRGIAEIREKFDFILIDCPPSLGLLTLNALTASDRLIIPIQAEFYALEGLTQLMKTVNTVTRRLNPPLSVLGILLTMFDSRTKLSLQVADEVKKYFGKKLFRTVIPRTVKLSEAPSFGQPISVYAPKSKGAKAYETFCREVLKRV